MKRLLFLFLLFLSFSSYAQVSVDTSGGNVIVKEKASSVGRSLSIFKTFIPFKGWCHHIVYDPNIGEYGDDPDSLFLNLNTELQHVKSMLDLVIKYKKYNFYRFAFNVAPYRDLMNKLVDIYSNSPEWNAYLNKAGSLEVVDTLYDGNQVSEVGYDRAVAASILDKSDFVKVFNDFFLPYGYRVGSSGFPADHQRVLSQNELRSLGKPETLFIPIPNSYFNLTKIQ